LDDAVTAHSKARQELQKHERWLDELEDKHAALKAAVNPFDAIEEKTAAKLQTLSDERDDVQAQHDASDAKTRLYSFWARGFKDLRLQLIAEALTELEIEVNSSVEALGLVGWSLLFQVDRETKGGNVKRGFSVLVKSPHNDNPVPWEAWSGGETQRLRLAANMGLSDLIRSRTGATIPLEVWDEPTQGLSEQGVQDLLEALASRARVEQRTIWIVDHHSHAFGDFKGSALVVKAPSGSRIRQAAV
jgi:exonuclease SbcC